MELVVIQAFAHWFLRIWDSALTQCSIILPSFVCFNKGLDFHNFFILKKDQNNAFLDTMELKSIYNT